MEFAFAHENLYPHAHPHVHFPFIADVLLSLTFAVVLGAFGKFCVWMYRGRSKASRGVPADR